MQNNWTSFLNRSAKYHLGTEPSVCGDCGSPVSRCLREFLWISYLVQSRLMKAHCTWYKSIIIHWTVIDNWDRVESIRVQDLNIIRRWPVDHLQKKVKDNKDLIEHQLLLHFCLSIARTGKMQMLWMNRHGESVEFSTNNFLPRKNQHWKKNVKLP